jgi:uncharacterized protein (DUF1800 family)
MQGENSNSRFVAPRSRGWVNGFAAVLVIGLGIAAQAAWAAEAFPVVRFYNEKTGTHFYTIDTAERDKVLSLYPWFDYEGVQFYAYKDTANGGQAVERFFNTKTGTHFYTISQSEKTFVMQNYPVFVYEGPAYYAMTSAGTDRTDLYRFYNTKTGAHFYTTSAAERDHVQATWPWFTFEGVAYQVFTASTPSGGGTGSSGPKATLAGSASTVTAPASVTLTATATDSGATITKVEFYLGAAKIGEATAAPYTLTYNITQAAAYLFSVVASDSLGATATSNTWTVQAASGGGSGNIAPKATLGVSSTTFTAGSSITMTATASDQDGTVAKVMFYEGANKLGESTTAPYTMSFGALTAGTYNLMAIAVDNLGAQGASNVVAVTASASGGGGNVAPKASLTTSATSFNVGTAITLTATATDQDGTIAKVMFFSSGTKISETGSPPYVTTFTTGTAGTYSLTAVAVDNLGAQGTSNAVSVQALPVTTGPTPPKISIAVGNTLVHVPATVTITANASATGATVTKVSLYSNGAKLVDLTSAPYTYAYNVTSAGTFAITGEVTDSLGGVTSTLPQTIVTVTTPPVVSTNADEWRFLNQATFGASQAEAARLQSLGSMTAWINDQFTQPVSGYPDAKYSHIQLKSTPDCTTTDPANKAYPGDAPQAVCARDHLTLAGLQRDFFVNAVTAPDQLRQRVAWALSQIVVTSGNEPDLSFAYVMSRYQNIFFQEAFGNYRTLLQKVTLNPAMGNYLDMVNNDRASGTRVPNENYAREIMQLFSVGLEELYDDGTAIMDAQSPPQPIPTYDQNSIKEFAKVFTGYTYADPAAPAAVTATKKNGVYYAANMIPYPTTATTGHETSVKNLLAYPSSVPASTGIVAANQTPQQDLDAAVDNVFNHPNTPAYVGRQLIQRLVTGNPSPAYVGRISAVFKNNGQGVRGDLKAVVKAILLDPEARGAPANPTTFGALREPVLALTAVVRALNGVTDGNRLAAVASNLGQNPYFSPTVFNYFPPDATIPGTSVRGPEFAIHTTDTAIVRLNTIYTLVYNGYATDPTVPFSTGTKIDLAQFASVADNPAAMVALASNVLTGGQFDPAAQAIVVTAVNAVPVSATPTAAERLARAQMAVYLMASSSQFQVQR